MVFVCILCLFFKIGTAVPNPHRRHQLLFIRSHDDGPIEHEGKPRHELYEKVDKQSDTSDVALFLDEHEEMLERRSTPCGKCDPGCNPCVRTRNLTQRPSVCECKDKDYCMQQEDLQDCKVNATWLLEKLLSFTDSTPKQLKMMCALSS